MNKRKKKALKIYGVARDKRVRICIGFEKAIELMLNSIKL